MARALNLSKSNPAKKVTVWRFKVYDVISDEYRVSARYGTKKGIAAVRGVAIEGSQKEAEAYEVSPDGLTAKDFGRSKRNLQI